MTAKATTKEAELPVSRYDRPLLSLEFVLIFMSMGAMFPFLNLYLKNTLHWSGTQIGLLTSLGSVVVLLSQPLWGRFSDARHKGKVLAVSLGSSAIIALFFPFATGFVVFTTLRLLHSGVSGSTASLYDGIVLDKLNEDSDAYGKFRLWGSLGFAAATMAMGKLYENTSFLYMFPVFSVLSGLACIIALVIKMPNQEPRQSEANSGSEPVRMGPVFANPALLLLLAGVFLVATANMAGENFLGLYIDALGAPASLTGYAWTLTALTEIPVFLVAPAMVRWLGSKQVLFLSTLMFGLKLVFNGVFPYPAMALVLQIMHGAAFALFQTSAVLMVDALVPRQFRSTGQALLGTVAWSLSGIIGSLAFGGLVDSVGIFRTFQLGGYVGVAGALFILLFVPGKRPQNQTRV